MTDSRRRVELFVRSLFPIGAHQRQERVVERLDRLEEAGRIETYSVVVWGERIATDVTTADTEEGRYVLDRIAEFKQWALAENVSLESFYGKRTVDSGLTDETFTALTLPVMGLAEYAGDELVHVAPCTDGETVRRVEDRLRELTADRPTDDAEKPDARHRSSTDAEERLPE